MCPRGLRLDEVFVIPSGSQQIKGKVATMSEKLEGIVSPSIDALMSKTDSKYGLVIFAAKRARQINDYYSALHEGSLFDNVGPLVDAAVDDKPLSIAMREIVEGAVVTAEAKE
jgi:DNA-directed RNA polymerase subunit omega